MISEENRTNQVESAILTLLFADNLLREREEIEKNRLLCLDRDDTPEPQGYSQAGVVSIQIVFTSTSIHKGKTKRQTYPKISSQLREILDVAAFESPEVGDAKG